MARIQSRHPPGRTILAEIGFGPPPVIREMPPRVRVEVEKVALAHGVPISDILSDKCKALVVRARYEAMRAVADLRQDGSKWPSTTQIAAWFGRDHTSVYRAFGRLARGR